MTEIADTPMLWCALRTAGPRTLNLARSLTNAGLHAWTPMKVTRRRLPRRKVIVEREGAILPTFVFAREDALPVLLRCLAMPRNPHPAFSIFRHDGQIAMIQGAALAPLRTAENRERERIERERLAEMRKARRDFAIGAEVKVPEGPFAGMTGVVQDGDGRFALVSFGGRFQVKIATFLLDADVLRGEGSVLQRTAA